MQHGAQMPPLPVQERRRATEYGTVARHDTVEQYGTVSQYDTLWPPLLKLSWADEAELEDAQLAKIPTVGADVPSSAASDAGTTTGNAKKVPPTAEHVVNDFVVTLTPNSDSSVEVTGVRVAITGVGMTPAFAEISHYLGLGN